MLIDGVDVPVVAPPDRRPHIQTSSALSPPPDTLLRRTRVDA